MVTKTQKSVFNNLLTVTVSSKALISLSWIFFIHSKIQNTLIRFSMDICDRPPIPFRDDSIRPLILRKQNCIPIISIMSKEFNHSYKLFPSLEGLGVGFIFLIDFSISSNTQQRLFFTSKSLNLIITTPNSSNRFWRMASFSCCRSSKWILPSTSIANCRSLQ